MAILWSQIYFYDVLRCRAIHYFAFIGTWKKKKSKTTQTDDDLITYYYIDFCRQHGNTQTESCLWSWKLLIKNAWMLLLSNRLVSPPPHNDVLLTSKTTIDPVSARRIIILFNVTIIIKIWSMACPREGYKIISVATLYRWSVILMQHDSIGMKVLSYYAYKIEAVLIRNGEIHGKWNIIVSVKKYPGKKYLVAVLIKLLFTLDLLFYW